MFHFNARSCCWSHKIIQKSASTCQWFRLNRLLLCDGVTGRLSLMQVRQSLVQLHLGILLLTSSDPRPCQLPLSDNCLGWPKPENVWKCRKDMQRLIGGFEKRDPGCHGKCTYQFKRTSIEVPVLSSTSLYQFWLGISWLVKLHSKDLRSSQPLPCIQPSGHSPGIMLSIWSVGQWCSSQAVSCTWHLNIWFEPASRTPTCSAFLSALAFSPITCKRQTCRNAVECFPTTIG